MTSTDDVDVFIDQHHLITMEEEPLVLNAYKALQTLQIKAAAGARTEHDQQRFKYLGLKLSEKFMNDSVELYSVSEDEEYKAKLSQVKIELAGVQDQIEMLVQECPQFLGFKKPKEQPKEY